jgi:hypothetical protein
VGRRRAETEELIEDDKTRLFGFRAAHVFDVTQTEGEPLPEFATVQGDPKRHTDRLKHFVAGQNIALQKKCPLIVDGYFVELSRLPGIINDIGNAGGEWYSPSPRQILDRF